MNETAPSRPSFPAELRAAIQPVHMAYAWEGEPLLLTQEMVRAHVAESGDDNLLHGDPHWIVPGKLLIVKFHQLLPPQAREVLSLAQSHGYLPRYRGVSCKFGPPLVAPAWVKMTAFITQTRVQPPVACVYLDYQLYSMGAIDKVAIASGTEQIVLTPYRQST